jgi:hypothetical protein
VKNESDRRKVSEKGERKLKLKMVLPHLPKDSAGRYPGIDIFRGIAIFTMLAANSAAESLAAPHHFWFRIYGSFAAPIFVFLAGFMVGIGYQKHPLSYFIKRGLEIIPVAALIDTFIWRDLPGTTFDVLYLTGLGIPVAAYTLKLKTPVRILLCILFFALGPILQHVYSYETFVHEFAFKFIPLSNSIWIIIWLSIIVCAGVFFLPIKPSVKKIISYFYFAILSVLAGIFLYKSISLGVTAAIPPTPNWWLKSWLFDGWFPVFPWMGFIIAGTLAFTHASRIVNNVKIFLPIGIILFLTGLTWLYFRRPIEEREGYSELFYPPRAPYLCAAIGAITIGLSVLKYLKPVFGLQFLRYLGSCSLFIYIFHSAIIYFVLDNYFTELSLKDYLMMYACFAAFMIVCAWILFELKHKPGWKKLPKFLRFIFGG